MKFHPPSLALLTSMALRYDHSFGLDAPLRNKDAGDSFAELLDLQSGFTPERRLKLIAKMYHIYQAIVVGETPDCDPISARQLTEEVSGTGFYSPKGEPYYLDMLKISYHEWVEFAQANGIPFYGRS